jgi:S-adenosylmethionine decarboxylase
MIDGYGADRKLMEDKDAIFKILDEFPSKINMHKLMVPHVIRYVGPKPEDWGISGFVIIAESHIAIHTFPERSYMNIDIFSCLDFDTEKAAKEMKQIFSLKRMKIWFVERGITYPHQLEAMADIVKSERLEISDSVKPAGSKNGNGKKQVPIAK